MKGSESVVSFSKMLGRKIAIKNRIQKSYRESGLDYSLRKTRTRVEARLLHKAKLAGVLCPTVLCVDQFALSLSFINGKRPLLNPNLAKQAGEILAKLHKADIIHGDFTPANLIVAGHKASTGIRYQELRAGLQESGNPLPPTSYMSLISALVSSQMMLRIRQLMFLQC